MLSYTRDNETQVNGIRAEGAVAIQTEQNRTTEITEILKFLQHQHMSTYNLFNRTKVIFTKKNPFLLRSIVFFKCFHAQVKILCNSSVVFGFVLSCLSCF